MKFDLVIRNGTVVNVSGESRCDVGIVDGVITAMGEQLPPGDEEIDATGKLVIPGGIDTHCHIAEPPEGAYSLSDGFDTATASAVTGGTTSMICFIVQEHGKSLTQSFEEYRQKASASWIDYGFHIIITDPSDAVLEELPSLIAAGNTSLKIFTTYDIYGLNDEQVLKVMDVARECGAFMCIHAENDAAIRYNTRRLVEAGKIDPKYHAVAKPIEYEAETINRMAMFVDMVGVPAQFFHISGALAAAEISRAQSRYSNIYSETCPQYLVLTSDDLDRDDREGEKFVFSPAARTKADQEALWQYIRQGVISVISSDHAPFNHGPYAHLKRPFTQIPNGLPGIGSRLPLVFSEGVAKGRIDIATFVALTATNPAKLFGLAPRKGTIAVGADADIVVWDPSARRNLTNADLNHANDYTPYEGMEIDGWADTTIVGGKIRYRNSKLIGTGGQGRYLARQSLAHPHENVRRG